MEGSWRQVYGLAVWRWNDSLANLKDGARNEWLQKRQEFEDSIFGDDTPNARQLLKSEPTREALRDQVNKSSGNSPEYMDIKFNLLYPSGRWIHTPGLSDFDMYIDALYWCAH